MASHPIRGAAPLGRVNRDMGPSVCWRAFVFCALQQAVWGRWEDRCYAGAGVGEYSGWLHDRYTIHDAWCIRYCGPRRANPWAASWRNLRIMHAFDFATRSVLMRVSFVGARRQRKVKMQDVV